MLSPQNIAVCLAVYNGMRWLPEQLKSILQQQGMRVTVFVSVDTSSDGSEAWVAKQAQSDDRIRLLPQRARFGSAARNFFRLLTDVDFSQFDYVSLADQDDIWLPAKLERACEQLQQQGAAAYSSNVIVLWPTGEKRLLKKSHRQARWDFLFEAAGPGCTYVLTRGFALELQASVRTHWEAIQNVGLHDWFIYAFARANKRLWFIDDYASMHYRQHENNQVGVNLGWKAYFGRARKITSGWGLSQALLIARLVGMAHEPFVTRWSQGGRLGLLALACCAGQCRRRQRDKWLFAAACVVLAVKGTRP